MMTNLDSSIGFIAVRPSRNGGKSRIARMIAGLALLAGMAMLTGCGGGATTETNPNPGVSGVVGYSGPAAQNESVRNFQTEIWPQLKSYCGNCHAPDTSARQEPFFARNDNVNRAYNAAVTVANLNTPATSRLVIRVGNGHNCWLTADSQCASEMTTWISNWVNGGSSGGSSGGGGSVVLSAPTFREPGGSRAFPASATSPSGTSFAETVWPILTSNCSGCHSEEAPAATRNSPFFASTNVDTAYEEAKSKIDLGDGDIPLGTPITDKVANSRLVVRLRDEFHNCWSGNCDNDALEMRNAIIRFAAAIAATGLDPADLTVSGALQLGEGQLVTSSGRDDSNIIARWEFREGAGNTVGDMSGVAPAMNLRLSGRYEWLGSNGIRFNGGRAQSTDARKLFDEIAATGFNEFSIEAWVIPDNTNQDNTYIASYSSGDTQRNMALGQSMYRYDVLARSSANGTVTNTGNYDVRFTNTNEVVNLSLQHVVINVSSAGREIYVDGELKDSATASGDTFANWAEDYLFTVADEASGGHAWRGVMRFLAVRNRVMTQAQVSRNFEAGIGEKRYLLFDIGNLDGVPANSYVMFEVSQLDEYAYLFYKPVFVNLDNRLSEDVRIKGMRLGVNGHLAPLGQAYAPLDVTVTEAQRAADVAAGEQGQVLSDIGTIIPVENGPDADEFFLAFEIIGGTGTAFVENEPPAPIRAEPDPMADIGVRTFEEINESMSLMTGVDTSNASVAAVYDTYRQQLPSVETIQAFVTSHQMAISQLALTYCQQMVQDPALRSAFFDTGYDFSFIPAEGARGPIIEPLLRKMMNVDGTVEVTSHPPAATVSGFLDDLLTEMCGNGGTGCTTPARIEEAVIGTCAAMLGSAAMLIQ